MTTIEKTSTTARLSAHRPRRRPVERLTPEQLEAFGDELDAIRQRVIAEPRRGGRDVHPQRSSSASAASRSPAARCSTCRRPGRWPSPR